jgi:hypothetical protein
MAEDLSERIGEFLDENDISPLSTIQRLVKEAKEEDPEFAAEIKEAASDCELTVANRIQSLLDEL